MRNVPNGMIVGALLWLAASSVAAAAPAGTAPAAAPAASAAPAWKVDYAKSKLGFSGAQTGKPFSGQFGKYDAKIALDPNNPAKSTIDVTVDMTSAKTGDKQRDSALPGSDWFKAKQFPTARYVAKMVEKKADGTYIAHGDLTIRGVTKHVPLPFTLKIDGKNAIAKGEATLIRTDFGVGQGDFADGTWVGLDVKVTIDIKASR
jgi:polyisoprenoid-binding protein YceI